MKASELINYLEAVKKEHGDIDVVCMVGEWDWDLAAPTPDNNEVQVAAESTLARENAGVESDKFLYLGIRH